jgi:hypothetical protein
MAAVQPLPNSAFVKVEVDFTSNWNTPTPVYTDVTSDVRLSGGLVWERGRNDEFQTVSPGSCQFTLNNRTRTYDPTTNLNMVPGRPARITCYYPTTATVFQQMQMQVEDWVPEWTLDLDSFVKANCIERFGGLAFTRIVSSAYISTTAVARLNDLADAGGWPSGSRLFTTGTQLLTAGQVYQGVDVLSSMQDVANGQGQVLYSDRAGVLTTKPMFAGIGANGGTFGDGGGAEIPFTIPTGGVGQGYLYTQVQLTAATGPLGPWTSGHPNTVTANLGAPYQSGKYGTRPFARNTAATTQTAAQTVATSLANTLTSLSSFRLQQVQIRPLANPALIFPVVLAADFGVPYTFTWQPPGGGSRISITAKLRSIRHEISESDWLVTWNLSP